MKAAKDELVARLTEFFLKMAREQFDDFDKWLQDPK